jgi:hypothetical protein
VTEGTCAPTARRRLPNAGVQMLEAAGSRQEVKLLCVAATGSVHDFVRVVARLAAQFRHSGMGLRRGGSTDG